MKKKVDSRIQTCITNGFHTNQRSIFVIVGDRARYQVVNFHYILAKQNLRTKPAVLWCYKKELGFSSHQKKRMKEVKNMQTKGLYDSDVDDPFQLFIASTDIKYSFYKDSHKVLGSTFQMLVLQDFQALTPNLLCRTIETVEGGGLIVFLLRTMTSLKQLYTMMMDVHQRYRTERFQEVQPRFNQRFILSLSECRNCLFMDDELNLLKVSAHADEIAEVTGETINHKSVAELQKLQNDLKDKEIIGQLVAQARTLDQAKAIMTFVDCIVQKTARSTISLTAARGRGKSAAVGLSVAAAIAVGFSNIFVSAPSPQNLKTFFQFLLKGLESLGYKDNLDYDKVESANEQYAGSIMRLNIFKKHHQFVQFVFPTDAEKIGNSDLVVIDEAAAIPLPLIKSFLTFPLVFLSSTVNGYEGTGRSLSLKLIQQIKEQNKKNGQELSSTRSLKEVVMTDPIRYALNDPIEKWLYDLLHLDSTTAVPLRQGIPHPNDCDLYLVNRDTLFSYKKTCEKFLHGLMSLFVSSHYKNSPNDMQLMSDSPSHMLFVLLGPLKSNTEGKTELPDILCAVQLCLEGQLSKISVEGNIERGMKPSGDLIPWNMREQYQDNQFPRLAGGRIVRIATHPSLQKMGYGTKALQQLVLFFERKLVLLDDSKEKVNWQFRSTDGKITQPLLKKLEEVDGPQLDYLGTSFGITKNLFRFWSKSKFQPVYVRQTRNDITAEHSCIMLRELESDRQRINLSVYVEDFKKRFLSLLGFEFHTMQIPLVVDILQPNVTTKEVDEETVEVVERQRLAADITLLDYKRIEAYSKNLADFHLIVDLLPALSRLFFGGRLGALRLSYLQAAILVGLGLQHKNIDAIAKEFNLPVSQCLALFNKAIRKIYSLLKRIFEKQPERQSGQPQAPPKAVGNRSEIADKAAREEKSKLASLEPASRYRFALKDEDLEGLQPPLQGQTVTIGRTLQQPLPESAGRKKVKRS